jgi:hypothetical protein
MNRNLHDIATTDRRPAPGPVAEDGSPRPAVVSVRSLSKRYGEVLAVDELTFSLERGTITGFLGPKRAAPDIPSATAL